jgi:tRNA threonylcarbamoyladenosine biosynthesis protein TsaE
MKKIQSTSLNDIPQLAKEVAKELKGGEILALVGDLGTGKTTFTQHLANNLKVKYKVTSPTFIVMNCFPGKLPKNKKQVTLYHLDLYRTKNIKEVRGLGITEFWGKPDTVTIIEWADKIKRYLPKDTHFIYFS